MKPSAIGYSAAMSACEKGKQWQLALSFLEELQTARVQDDGFVSLPISVFSIESIEPN